MSVGSRAEMFNIVSIDHGRTHKCDFSVFNRKFPFWENLVKKIKSMVAFILFALDWKYPFSNKLGPKIQNYQFKLKLETSANLNIQNLMELFSFSILDRKHPFRTNLVQKMKVVSLS